MNNDRKNLLLLVGITTLVIDISLIVYFSLEHKKKLNLLQGLKWDAVNVQNKLIESTNKTYQIKEKEQRIIFLKKGTYF